MSTSAYICGVDAASLEAVISKVAPLCQHCHYAMKHVCVEACCTGDALFCEECDQITHLGHRSNTLSVLFHHKSQMVDRASYWQTSLGILLKNLQTLKQMSESIAQTHQKLIAVYNKVIKEAEEALANTSKNKWYPELYGSIEGLLLDRISLGEARAQFL